MSARIEKLMAAIDAQGIDAEQLMRQAQTKGNTMSNTKCGPNFATWFARGVWPTCNCGYNPRDNLKLTQHWADAGFTVVDSHGSLKVKAL